MADKKHPTWANGKICYIEIPSTDIKQSAAFYQKVFDWSSGKTTMVIVHLTIRWVK